MSNRPISTFLGIAAAVVLATNSPAAIVDVTVGPGGAVVFSPADIIINVGDTVRWTWDSGGHNVGSGLPGNPTPFFLSGPLAPAGTVFEVLFDQAFLDANPVLDNVYDYHCHPHGFFKMIGSVTVVVCPGDVNGDGSVNVLDLIAVLLCFGDPATPPCDTGQDVNGDGDVNVLDLIALIMNFGPCDAAIECLSDAGCDDENPCTIDLCIRGHCFHAPLGPGCDDG